MGQGGHIKIVNNTDSRMKMRYCKKYQMDAWRFPDTIDANASATFYVEWDEGIFHNKSDDRGTAIYFLEKSPDKEVHFTLYNAKERNFNVTRLHFEGIPSKPEKIRWLHDGTMVVTVEEKGQKNDPEEKPEDKSKEYDLSGPVTATRWMGWIADETPINKINIPGTHDSFAYDVPNAVIESTAKTQKINIQEQLNIGCRFLDIRINQDLAGRHGIIDCADDFWKAMEWISAFLKENPKETIFMRIKLENEDNVSILTYNLELMLTQYSKLFWRRGSNTEWPKIKDVRGKIIVLDNFDCEFFLNKGYGFKYDDDMPNLLIQDDYNPSEKIQPWESGPHIREKYKLSVVKENIEKPYDPSKLKINYVSAVSGAAGAVGIGLSPKDYADYLNHRVVEYIQNKAQKEECFTGAILFDFMDENIAKTVFSTNNLK